MKDLPKIRIIRLRGRNQITLPDSVVRALSLEEGDHLAAVIDDDGVVRLRPAKIEVAGTSGDERAIKTAEADLAAGRAVKFSSVKSFTDAMLAAHDEQMAEAEEPSHTTMLVHVGDVSMSVSVHRDGVPILTRNIELGRVSATPQAIAQEVGRTLDFFSSSVEGPPIERVYLSAGPPRMPELQAEIGQVTSLPLTELTPVAHASESEEHGATAARRAIDAAKTRAKVSAEAEEEQQYG